MTFSASPYIHSTSFWLRYSVVMPMDHGADVGAQAQDLAVEIVADAGGDAAMDEIAGDHVGDDDVLDRHLLERHARMLGIGEPVRIGRMRHADGDVAEAVVDE